MSLRRRSTPRCDELVGVWDSGRVGPTTSSRTSRAHVGPAARPAGHAVGVHADRGVHARRRVASSGSPQLLPATRSPDRRGGRASTVVRAAIDRCRRQADVLGRREPRGRVSSASPGSGRRGAQLETIGAAVAAHRRPRSSPSSATHQGDRSARRGAARRSTPSSTRSRRARRGEAARARALAARCTGRSRTRPLLAIPEVERARSAARDRPRPPTTIAATPRRLGPTAPPRLARRAGSTFGEPAAASATTCAVCSGVVPARRDQERPRRGRGARRAVRAAHDVLCSAPCDVATRAVALVADYQHAVRVAVGADPSTSRDSPGVRRTAKRRHR